MEYKLYRIASDLIDLERKQYTDQFIDELNMILSEDDIYLSEDSDSLFNIVLVESGGSEEKFTQLFPTLKRPLILINTSKYNSLAATFEISTYIRQNNEEPYVFYGDVNEVARVLKRLNDALMIKYEIQDMNLGVIGEPSSWLIASKVDYQLAKEKLDVNIIDISYDEFISEIDKKYYDFPKNYDELYEKASNKDDLINALNIYGALKRIIAKYDLKGLTVRCFDLITSHKSTACLALGLLNSEGIIATCEGDVPSLLTMVLLEKCLNYSSFQANPSFISIEKGEIIFSHCTLPLNMCKTYSFDTHFESGLGIGIKGELEKGPITITKISNDLKKFICVEGQIEDNLSLKGYCRTQIKVKLNPESMYTIATSSVGNHMIISYGKNYMKVVPLFTMLFSIEE